MAFAVRAGNPARERAALIALHGRYLTQDSNDLRWGWLYGGNPSGEAKIWVAEDDGELVGAASAFPRQLWLDRACVQGCVFGDFCIAPKYRSLGPAMELQRACLDSVRSGWFKLAYDFPTDGMMAVYRRMAITPDSPIAGLVKPLALKKCVSSRIRAKALASAAAIIADAALRARTRALRSDRSVVVRVHAGRCGEDFTDLAYEHSERLGTCVFRSASYLNWRFLDRPGVNCHVLVARRDEKLVGYAVLTLASPDARLLDLFGLADPPIFFALLKAAEDWARARQAERITAEVTAGHPYFSILTSFGFWSRKTSPVVTYGPTSGPGEQPARVAARLLLSAGDRDT